MRFATCLLRSRTADYRQTRIDSHQSSDGVIDPHPSLFTRLTVGYLVIIQCERGLDTFFGFKNDVSFAPTFGVGIQQRVTAHLLTNDWFRRVWEEFDTHVTATGTDATT
jgi:hypothetical protein